MKITENTEGGRKSNYVYKTPQKESANESIRRNCAGSQQSCVRAVARTRRVCTRLSCQFHQKRSEALRFAKTQGSASSLPISGTGALSVQPNKTILLLASNLPAHEGKYVCMRFGNSLAGLTCHQWTHGPPSHLAPSTFRRGITVLCGLVST